MEIEGIEAALRWWLLREFGQERSGEVRADVPKFRHVTAGVAEMTKVIGETNSLLLRC